MTEMGSATTGVPSGRLGVIVGVLLAALVVPPVVFSSDADSLLKRCGVSDRNIASEILQLNAARDIWLEFPAMMRAPMLETDVSATVVIFPANYDVRGVSVGRPDLAPPTNNGIVVCIVADDGYAGLFTNIDPTGSRLTR